MNRWREAVEEIAIHDNENFKWKQFDRMMVMIMIMIMIMVATSIRNSLANVYILENKSKKEELEMCLE